MTRKKDLSFVAARARLLEILREVEGDSGDVDQLAERVQEAAELIRFCNERLSAARAQVTQIVADLSAVEQSMAREAQAGARAGAAPSAKAEGAETDAEDGDDAGDAETVDDEASEPEEDDAADTDEGAGGAARRGAGRLPF